MNLGVGVHSRDQRGKRLLDTQLVVASESMYGRLDVCLLIPLLVCSTRITEHLGNVTRAPISISN